MIQKFLTMLVVLMMLIPSVIAAPNENANPKAGLKIVDQSKGTMKEIKNDNVKGIKTSSTDIVIDEKNKNSIKLKDSKPSKGAKEHKKVKVSIPASELQKIDADNDGVFGVLEIADDGTVIGQRTATTAQLVAGDNFTFSDVEINGFSGYREETFADAKSGDILNIVDVSGNYTMTMSVDGTIPTSTPIIATDASTYPNSTRLMAGYLFNSNSVDVTGVAGGTDTNMTYINGVAVFNGVDSKIVIGNVSRISVANPAISIQFKELPTIHTKEIFGKMDYSAKKGIRVVYETNSIRCYIGNGTTTAFSSIPVSSIKANDTVTYAYNGNKLNSYINGKYYNNATLIGPIVHTTGAAVIGSTYYNAFQKTQLYDLFYYNGSTAADIQKLVAGGSGIFANTGVENYTAYNVASGVEKIISTGGTSTVVNYIDTSGETRNVTIRTYYTQDTTKTSQSSDDDFHNISIAHNSGVALTNGTIAREIPPLYTGTAVLDSNNTNAVMTQNRTHFTIYTGTLTTSNWFGYNVSVPNNADHGMWLNRLMQWVSGVGWNFVGDAPADYTDDLSNQITVMVS